MLLGRKSRSQTLYCQKIFAFFNEYQYGRGFELAPMRICVKYRYGPIRPVVCLKSLILLIYSELFSPYFLKRWYLCISYSIKIDKNEFS
jgi:hypothetical protein